MNQHYNQNESIWTTYKRIGSILSEEWRPPGESEREDPYAAFGKSKAARKRRADIKKKKALDARMAAKTRERRAAAGQPENPAIVSFSSDQTDG